MQFSDTWNRVLVFLVIYVLIIVGGHFVGEALKEAAGFDSFGNRTRHGDFFLWFGTALFVVFLAVPFVPGIEISVALFSAFGRDVAPLIYFASIAALSISFFVGRLFPLRAIVALFRFLRLEKAEKFVKHLVPLKPRQRLRLLVESAPTKIIPFLVRYRYIALAVALNLPGNAIIGGGGGIAMLAGISRLFAPVPFLVTVAIAVVPIPLAFYVYGRVF